VVVAHSEVSLGRLRKTTTTVRHYILSHKHYTVMIGSRSIAIVNTALSLCKFGLSQWSELQLTGSSRESSAEHKIIRRTTPTDHLLTRHHRTYSCSLVEKWTATAEQPPPRNLIVAGPVLRSCVVRQLVACHSPLQNTHAARSTILTVHSTM
jgi:hypothetical protein